MNLYICINTNTVDTANIAETAQASTEILCSVEKIIDFGAHSREFLDYLFECDKAELVRNENNLKKLLKNGMSLYALFECEKKAIGSKTPEEVKAILEWYVEHIDSLDTNPEDRDYRWNTYPLDLCTQLILSANLRKAEERDLVLRATRNAGERGLMSENLCADHIFLYDHDFDLEAWSEMRAGDSSEYAEEYDNIRYQYFSDDYGEDEEY